MIDVRTPGKFAAGHLDRAINIPLDEIATDVEAGAPFYLRPIQPAADAVVFSHSVSPQAVLHLAGRCFDARPKGWLLGIRAVDLGSFAEGLTPQAEANLRTALEAFCAALHAGRLAP